MTPRGRATLIVLAFAAAVGIRTLAGGASVGSAPAGPPPAAPDPAVATDRPALVPAAVLGRLPLGVEAYAQPTDAEPGTKLVEQLESLEGDAAPLEIEYTLDVALTRSVYRILRRGRVALGHVVVLDPASGDLLAYATTDPEAFPPTGTYPAASLVKVVTAAAALDAEKALPTCRSRGNPWRLTRARLNPDEGGKAVSLRRALATSNNQCFGQLAVHAVGVDRLLGALRRFGWLNSPALAHGAGEASHPGDDALALGRLGCGLAGCRITPLHAASLAATLADGRRVPPRWIAAVRDHAGRELALPPPPPAQRVLSPELAGRLREMLVDTTERGTARRAFRTRRGPLLQGIRVAGKTGSLNGRDPDGRYEWFIAAAPAAQPRVAVAVLVVYGDLWWMSPAQLTAEVLKVLFCPRGVCREEALDRWLEPQRTAAVEPEQPAPSQSRPEPRS
jgi:cell division protein FtsI/penicillin-binding protein 2